jgi:hypothetical protein
MAKVGEKNSKTTRGFCQEMRREPECVVSYTVENPGGNDTNEESLRYIEAYPITPD